MQSHHHRQSQSCVHFTFSDTCEKHKELTREECDYLDKLLHLFTRQFRTHLTVIFGKSVWRSRVSWTSKMELEGSKYLAMFLLGAVSLFLGFIPLKIGKHFVSDDKEWKRTLTSVLLCFGGGVLFATSMIHMLPEVRLEKCQRSKRNYSYYITHWGKKSKITIFKIVVFSKFTF